MSFSKVQQVPSPVTYSSIFPTPSDHLGSKPESDLPHSVWLETPLVDRADTEAVSGLLTTLTSLEAKAFVDDPVAEFGLEQGPTIEVMLAGEEEPWTLRLGHPVASVLEDGADRYARLGQQILELDATRLEEPLTRGAQAWRSLAWSQMQIFKVDEATFELEGKSFSVRRDAGDWLRGEDKIAYTTASDALYPFSEARADELIDESAASAAGHPLSAPRLEATFTASDGAEEALKLYPTAGERAAATLSGRDVVLLLPADKAEEIVDKVIALRDAEPLAEEEAGEGETASP